MMSVFDSFKRVDQDSAGHAEPAFQYLNRLAGPVFARIREYLEEWFSRYPDANKSELKARFRSSIDSQHQSAFFELLLHELLLCLGADIDVHPPIQGSSRSPDFLVQFPKNSVFYLEATVVTFK